MCLFQLYFTSARIPKIYFLAILEAFNIEDGFKEQLKNFFFDNLLFMYAICLNRS